MILINGVKILTVLDDMTWEGAKDIVTRSLSFSFLYNPQVEDMPRYNCKVGDRVEWIENDKTLFLGYIESTQYNTDDDSISITCHDYASRLARSKFVGRMRGTLNELANNICGSFNIKNGINVDNSHVHNIVSDGDLTYYEVLKTACDTLFDRYTIYMEGDTLKLSSQAIQVTFETGLNIRSSNFSQSLSDMVTKVLVIDNDGNLLNSVEDKENLQKFGLFQETYNYNKDVTNNLAEAKKLLKGITNEATIVTSNLNNCISGRYIAVNEPINGLNGVFEILSDSHVIGIDSVMTLEIEYVYGIQKSDFIESDKKIQEEISKTPEGSKNENAELSIDEYLEQKRKEIDKARAEMIKKMEAEGYVLVNGEWRKLD
jgi:hypothetical protein